jgi:hypothetical protein
VLEWTLLNHLTLPVHPNARLDTMDTPSPEPTAVPWDTSLGNRFARYNSGVGKISATETGTASASNVSHMYPVCRTR